ncbi:MAG: histidine--tRNA ligase [Candidatus Berkelbacteria bacterium]|nr:histidine--tRNA ligase [Candidatus Berkelbacteria bacterium]
MSNEKRLFQKPRGTRDILPAQQSAWRFFELSAENVLFGLGFSKIDTPIFEDRQIFERSAGAGTDIVEKELFSIESRRDDEENSYVLRPEGTAGVVRAYIENGMMSWPQPVRLFYFGPMFRYERPQAGRFREHRQLGLEIIGDASAESDFLSIFAAIEILKKLSFNNITLAINSIGCPKCRPKFIDGLKKYYSAKLENLCEDCRRRYESNPLRLLDCKNSQCQSAKNETPKFVNFLDDECKEHFADLKIMLDDFGIKYTIDNSLVRGFDYYTKTVFEISAGTDAKRVNTFVGGGRYDGLVETLGGAKTPAVGFGMGADRVVAEIISSGVKIPKPLGVEIYLICFDNSAKEMAMKVYRQIDDAEINIFYLPSDDSLSNQLKSAAKIGAEFAIIIGENEVKGNQIVLRDLEKSTQEIIKFDDIIPLISKRLLRSSQ